MNKFNKKIREWLLPLGYKEIYRIPHPNENKEEVHFIKEKIRVVCKKEGPYECCHLHMDIFKEPFAFSIKTGNYKIETKELKKLHQFVTDQYKLINKKK